MNEFGVTLIWLAFRITIVCVVILIINVILQRREKATALPALTGFLLVFAVTFACFSPWPRWEWSSGTKRDQPVTLSQVIAVSQPPVARSPSAPPDTDQPAVQLESATFAAWRAFTETIRNDLMRPSVAVVNNDLNWTGWFAVLALGSLTVGTGCLVLGWVSVHLTLRRSRPVDDSGLSAQLDSLILKMGYEGSVVLRESAELASAATVGCWRPYILLPTDWTTWTYQQRQVVLAHELAHIASRDAISWLVAQVGLVLHFYHPLVHWLARQLRLNQELVADAGAAALTGGSNQYLVTLAELALRQPDSRMAWPATAFLPGKGTLLRRIEMLRTSKAGPATASGWRRNLLLAMAVVTGFVVSGVRRPATGGAVAALPTSSEPASALASQAESFNFESVSPSTVLMVGLRPSQLAEHEALKPLKAMLEQFIEPEDIGFGIADIDQFLVIGIPNPDSDRNSLAEPIMEIRTTKDVDFGPFISHYLGTTTSQDVSGVTVHSASDVSTTPQAQSVWVVDNRTIIRGPFNGIAHFAEARENKHQGPMWMDRADHLKSGQLAFALDVSFLRPEMQKDFARRPNPMLGMVAPLWQNTDLMTAGVNLSEDMTVAVHGWGASEDAAKQIETTVKTLLPVAQGLLHGARAQVPSAPPEARPMIEQGIKIGEEALQSAKVTQEGEHVQLSLSADGLGVATMTGLLLPAIQQAREAARRTVSKNNIKQIMLALHNYQAVHGEFPPAVLLGPDGETQYSWRIAILPYIEEQELYELYRRDEPWDSEHNKALLSKMPSVYRHPSDVASSVHAAYLGMTGERTAFGDTPGVGNKVRTFTDGTSNTAMIFEAQREIPWTKPADIPYSDDMPLPELGGFHVGGYNAGLADGSVRFISKAIAEATLRNIIKRNDGNPIGL